MMDVTRHKSVDVLRGYVRDADFPRSHRSGIAFTEDPCEIEHLLRGVRFPGQQ
jgi:hypothetical protein